MPSISFQSRPASGVHPWRRRGEDTRHRVSPDSSQLRFVKGWPSLPVSIICKRPLAAVLMGGGI